MNTKVEAVKVNFDTLKIVIAVLITAGAIAGFYIFSDQSQLLRVVGLLACMGVAVVIALQTEQGRTIWAFIQDAQVEVRKVVWPTRQETLQTTGIVILMVLVFAAILWLLDIMLGAGIQTIIGQGG